MKSISSIIKECLDKNELNYQHNEEYDSFYFNVGCESTDLDFYIQIRGNEYISFVAGLPIAVPKESYANLCQVINEINAETMIVTLYLQKESGKLYGQSFAIVHEGEIHEEVILRHIGLTMHFIDSRVKEILKNTFGGSSDDTLSQLLMKQFQEDAQENPIFN